MGPEAEWQVSRGTASKAAISFKGIAPLAYCAPAPSHRSAKRECEVFAGLLQRLPDSLEPGRCQA